MRRATKFCRVLKNNMAIICMGFGLFAALAVLVSWLYGYWSNGLRGTTFEINSCWQGISACGVGLVGLFKWLIDSSQNSPRGRYPSPLNGPRDPPECQPRINGKDV